MVEVQEQPRWCLGRYREVYAFELEAAVPRLPQRIVEFYGGSRRLRELVIDKDAVHFRRGSWLGSALSPWERHHHQQVHIAIEEQGELGAKVTCRFDCRQPYPTVFFPPRDLEREVTDLAAHLQQTLDA